MSPENMSASCVAMASGTLASSVAANSEDWIVPLPRRVWVSSGTVSIFETNLSPWRVMLRRVKWVSCCSADSAA